MDTRIAQALINKEPGLAAKVLLSIKQQLDGLTTNLQVRSKAALQQQPTISAIGQLLPGYLCCNALIKSRLFACLCCAGIRACQQKAAAVHRAHIAITRTAGGSAPQNSICSTGCQQQQVSAAHMRT